MADRDPWAPRYEAGSTLDAKVLRQVFGVVDPDHTAEYSSASWPLVLEQMANAGFIWEVRYDPYRRHTDSRFSADFKYPSGGQRKAVTAKSYGSTPGEAVCNAALLAVEKQAGDGS